VKGLLSALAVLQLTVPQPPLVSLGVVLVPLCGAQAGHSVPLRLPLRDDGTGGPCCGKICHISMRKRTGGDSCCGEEDDSDVA
jgi:hypothetical protein